MRECGRGRQRRDDAAVTRIGDSSAVAVCRAEACAELRQLGSAARRQRDEASGGAAGWEGDSEEKRASGRVSSAAMRASARLSASQRCEGKHEAHSGFVCATRGFPQCDDRF